MTTLRAAAAGEPAYSFTASSAGPPDAAPDASEAEVQVATDFKDAWGQFMETQTGQRLGQQLIDQNTRIDVYSHEDFQARNPGAAGVADHSHIEIDASWLHWDTTYGASLLAHEATHVWDQRNGVFDPINPGSAELREREELDLTLDRIDSTVERQFASEGHAYMNQGSIDRELEVRYGDWFNPVPFWRSVENMRDNESLIAYYGQDPKTAVSELFMDTIDPIAGEESVRARASRKPARKRATRDPAHDHHHPKRSRRPHHHGTKKMHNWGATKSHDANRQRAPQPLHRNPMPRVTAGADPAGAII